MRIRKIALATIALAALQGPVIAGQSWPSVSNRVSAFFGDKKGSYILPNKPIKQQVMIAVSGPGKTINTSDGGRILDYCRSGNCREKARIQLDSTGNVSSVGLVSFHCSPRPERKTICQTTPYLDIFVKRDFPSGDIADIEAWGGNAAGKRLTSEIHRMN